MTQADIAVIREALDFFFGQDAYSTQPALQALSRLQKGERVVSIKDGAESVRAVFDLSLIGPDTGFKPEDIAEALAKRWGLSYVS